MGNVVSSLVMYALQAAWFCQRLIDQDYRQNHGSRSKPIMGIHETDLDVFLSKCRAYYRTKGDGHRQIQSEKEESNRKSNYVHPVETPILGDSAWSKGADSLHFDNENFLSRMDQQVSLSQPDFSRLIIDKNDLDYLLSKSMELSRGRRKSESPKTERRKRKKGYYRKRYNPRGGDRGRDMKCALYGIAKDDSLLTVEDTDLGSCDDSSGVNTEEYAPTRRMRKRLTLATFPRRCADGEPSLQDHCYSLPKTESYFSLPPPVPRDLILVIRESDSKCCGDRDLTGMDHKQLKMTMTRECLTGSFVYNDF